MKTVAYSSPLIPVEWLAAHGLRPWRMMPQGAAQRPGTREGLCAFAQALAQEWLAETTRFDGMILATTCDQMRRASEWPAPAGGTPVFLMNVPATWQAPTSVRLYRDELERLGRFLAGLGGREPSRRRLAEVMEDYDVRRTALRGLVGRLGARQASEAMARFYLGEPVGPQEDAPVANGAGASAPPASAQAANGAAPARQHGIPVALIGGPLMHGDGRVFDAIERAGGVVVLDGTENGTRTLPAPPDLRRLRDDPMMELVDAYFGTIPDAFRRPDSMLYAWLGRELAASGARGIIVWRYVWCDMWAASVGRLRESTGLPVLDLDVSGDGADFERTTHRISAFMEVLR
jgi:benzoyl-CoA reductase/2-hydroxyglutaryl-CoA dehydratase subunit BcrC/BadD/HgdB